jgi:hypothetical protein
VYFWDRVSPSICPGGLWTSVLPISVFCLLLLLLLFFFCTKVLLCKPQAHLTILCFQPLKCWDYRYVRTMISFHIVFTTVSSIVTALIYVLWICFFSRLLVSIKRKKYWDFDWDCVEFIDQFDKNAHLNNALLSMICIYLGF